MRRGVSSTITSDPVSSPVSGFLCQKKIGSQEINWLIIGGYSAALTIDYAAI